MSTQRTSLYLSLLIHLIVAAGFLYGRQLLDDDRPPLIVDFSLSVSEAMAGEPEKAPGAPAAASTSTPNTSASQPQAAPTPATPSKQPASKPVTKPITKSVKVAQPHPQKSQSRPKKVHKKPQPMVTKSIQPAPLTKTDQAQTPPAVTSSATAAGSAGPASTAGVANARTQASTGTGAKGGNHGKGSGMRYDFNYVRQRILRNLRFPEIARKMGLSGKIVVSFVLKTDGQVERITVVSSSGHKLLDNTVVSTIRRVAPFPRPPVSAQLMLPIVFHLKS